jgi:hypothetical protein
MFTKRIGAAAPAFIAALMLGASGIAGCATQEDRYGRGYEDRGYDQGYGEPMPGEPEPYTPQEGAYGETPGTTGQTRNPYETDY